MMPGMNGVEVLQRILALRATLPVIIVTARADATLAEQTRALGAFAYVTKPFEFAYLARIVHLALTRSGEGAGGGAQYGFSQGPLGKFLYCRVRAAPPAYRPGV